MNDLERKNKEKVQKENIKVKDRERKKTLSDAGKKEDVKEPISVQAQMVVMMMK